MQGLGVHEWQQLSRLYDEALDIDESQREAWIAALDPQWQSLVPRLRQMLAAHSEVDEHGFLGGAAAPAPASLLRAGIDVGPYRIERLLGRGGMAEVWLARRAEGGLQRNVALKLLHGWRTGSAFAPRFERERDILAGLNHPHIASLFDAGTSAQGWPYLVLEFVDGESITDHADRLHLSLRARIELFRQALLAVRHAHAQLVLHRDLKPANILVTAEGTVKLLDFGIAKLLAPTQSQTDDTDLTREAGRPLTPRYASPEQLLGKPLSTASDVYSLGVVLYELLCGQSPCVAGSDLPGALERAIIETEPRPASQQIDAAVAAARGTDTRGLQRALASELDALLGKALAKEPAQRYGSVDLLLADIDRWLVGAPVLARPPSTWRKLSKFAGRHRVGVALGSVAVASLVTLTTVALFQAQRARTEAATALAARSFLLDLFRGADPQSSGGSELSARALLDLGRRQAGALQGQPALQLDLLRGIGEVQLFISDYDNAALAQQDVLRLQHHRGNRRGAALAQAELADIALRQGGYDEAEKLVVAAAEAAAPDDHELQFRVAELRGWLAQADEQPQVARGHFEQALAHAQAFHGDDSLQAIDALRGLVTVAADGGEYTAALVFADRARSLAEHAPGITARDRLGIEFDRISLLYRSGRYRDATVAAAAGGPGCARQLGAADETCVMQTQLQLLSMLRLGDRDGLQAQLPALVGVLDRIPAGRRSAEALIVAVRALAEAGQLDRQPALREQLARQAQSAPSDDLPSALVDRSTLLMAELALREGRVAEARRWLQAFAARQAADQPPPLRLRAQAGLVEGWAWHATGDLARADQALQSARRDHAGTFGELHPQTLSVDLNLAALRGAQGRAADGLALVDAALPGLGPAWGQESNAYRRALGLQARLRDVAGGIATSGSFEPAFFN